MFHLFNEKQRQSLQKDSEDHLARLLFYKHPVARSTYTRPFTVSPIRKTTEASNLDCGVLSGPLGH